MASRGRFAAEALASLPSDSGTPPAAAPLMPPPAGIPSERGSLGWPLPEPRAHRRPAQHSGDRTVGGIGQGTSATWLAPETSGAAAAACGGAEQDALATVSLGVAAATERLLRAAEESGAAQQQLEAAVEALTAVESRAAAGLRSRLELLASSHQERLERLEASFLAQAEAIRTELTTAVRDERHAAAAAVATRADELCAALARCSQRGSSTRWLGLTGDDPADRTTKNGEEAVLQGRSCGHHRLPPAPPSTHDTRAEAWWFD